MTAVWSVARQLHGWIDCGSRDVTDGTAGSGRGASDIAFQLGGCLDDSCAMMHLRQVLWRSAGYDPSGLDDAAVVARVTELVRSGALCTCSGTTVVTVSRGAGRGAPPAAQSPSEAPPPPARPFRQRAAPPVQKTWLQIEMVGEDDKPIAGVRFSVTLPDGSVRSGFLNKQGRARFEDIDPGQAMVSFPDLDRDAWEPI